LNIYVINLKRDIAKKNKFIENNHEILKGKYTFVDAVDGKLLDIDASGYNQAKAIKHIKRDMSAGEIGCYLSHMSIYQKIVDENLPYAVIFEDDITITDDNFLNIVDIACKKPYYDICLLGFRYRTKDKIKKMFYERLCDTYDMLKLYKNEEGGYGYIITNGACKKLLKYKNDIFLPIDNLGRHERFGKFLTIASIYPSVISVDLENSGLEQERILTNKQSPIHREPLIKNFFNYISGLCKNI